MRQITEKKRPNLIKVKKNPWFGSPPLLIYQLSVSCFILCSIIVVKEMVRQNLFLYL